MRKFIIISILVLGVNTLNHAQIISTIAGTGSQGYNGDGIQATNAELYYPGGVIFDGSGNLYIADNFNNRIRKIDASGVISTVAGNGTAGYTGDGGQATAAEIAYPGGIRFDPLGNMYIADRYNYVIRKVNPSGIISTFAGNGTSGYSGDGGQASIAELSQTYDEVFDASGNLYIADYINGRVRKVNTSGIISTYAGGGGSLGDGGQATAAQLAQPNGLNFDHIGNLYISDGAAGRIRMVSPAGIITTVAGNGIASFSGDGGPATAAEISPKGVVIDASYKMYITDCSNNRIRVVSSGIINTVIGNGTGAFSGDGGPATAAEIYAPCLGVFDASGNYYFADEYNYRVRKVVLPSEEGINELSNSEGLLVYPNPANDNIFIQLKDHNSKGFLDLFNISGQELIKQEFSHVQNISLPVGGLPPGTYLLKVQLDNGNVLVKRLEISR